MGQNEKITEIDKERCQEKEGKNTHIKPEDENLRKKCSMEKKEAELPKSWVNQR